MLLEVAACFLFFLGADQCDRSETNKPEQIYAEAVSDYYQALDVADLYSLSDRKKVRLLQSAYHNLATIILEHPQSKEAEFLRNKAPEKIGLRHLERRLAKLNPKFQPLEFADAVQTDAPLHFSNKIASSREFAGGELAPIRNETTDDQNNSRAMEIKANQNKSGTELANQTRSTIETLDVAQEIDVTFLRQSGAPEINIKQIQSNRVCKLSDNINSQLILPTHHLYTRPKSWQAPIFTAPILASSDSKRFTEINAGRDEVLPSIDGVFHTVNFQLNSYAIRDEDFAKLDRQAANLNTNPKLDVVIEGHADERGTRDYNIALGFKRAQSVRDYLVAKGVNAKRIKLVSYGKEKPLIKGSNEKAWAKNRRAVTVDFERVSLEDHSPDIRLAETINSSENLNSEAAVDTKDSSLKFEDEKPTILGEQVIVPLIAAAAQAQNDEKDIGSVIQQKAEELALAQIEETVRTTMPNTEISLTGQEDGKPKIAITTVQPIIQTEADRDTVFVQGSVASSDGGNRYTANLGFGYRRLSKNERWLFGVNTFLDYEFPYDHKRVSAGLEIKSAPLELTANKYRALTGWRVGPAGINELAVDGYDLEVGVQVPYLPSSRVYARQYKWDGVSGSSDLEGREYSVAVSGFLGEGWTLEAKHDAPEQGNSTNSIALTYRIKIGEIDGDDVSAPLISKQPFKFGSVRHKTLDKVRRQNEIVKVQSGLTLSFR
jgi:peptidoglycan-associated lipoprotein